MPEKKTKKQNYYRESNNNQKWNKIFGCAYLYFDCDIKFQWASLSYRQFSADMSEIALITGWHWKINIMIMWWAQWFVFMCVFPFAFEVFRPQMYNKSMGWIINFNCISVFSFNFHFGFFPVHILYVWMCRVPAPYHPMDESIHAYIFKWGFIRCRQTIHSHHIILNFT